jgi:peroxidase
MFESVMHFVKNFLLIFVISYVCCAIPSLSVDSYDSVVVHSSQPLYTSSQLSAYESSPDYVSSVGAKYDPQREYAPELAGIYVKYLSREQYGAQCDSYAKSSSLTDGDLQEAMNFANQQIQLYEGANQQYLAIDPRGLNFSAYIFGAILQSRYNEFTTQYLMAKKCISRLDVAAVLPKVGTPVNKNQEYCNINRPTSGDIKCDPNYKYRLMNGRCNNLANTNWGSSFHCHRRLLPPDFSDGINRPRAGTDGLPLPSPRLLTEFVMPDIPVPDDKRTGMNMMWGQFMVHDSFRTIQNLGLAINCCLIPNVTVHPECAPITNFPQDEATRAFNNQQCLNTVRSAACNTCSLGPRDQLNVATQVLDLSNLYGGNLIDDSLTLRSFVKGLMRGSLDMNGNETLPVRRLPKEQDTLDLTPCNPPINNPELDCYHSGDGIRGNQQPGVNSIHVMMRKRHNQHAKALARVNPHWDDETLFQEARRLLIAETTKIHYGEYMPSILGEKLMEYFGLNLQHDGYTKYNPHIDPATIQAVAVAALRMGHSQIFSQFNVLSRNKYGYGESYSFLLRNKFFEMSDIWTGNSQGILRGLIEAESDNNVDPFIVTDVKDFLFFNPRTTTNGKMVITQPSVIDLSAININRGREHGVAGYIYYLEYCTGAQIKGWSDLKQFIPESRIQRLRQVYREVSDIDLFVGGLSENRAFGSILGPTFACLNGIQFHHWKYGDRFYFEHGGEAGSFKPEQLNNIRQTASLANLICKTNDFDAVQANPQFRPSEHNPNVPCHAFAEIDYDLWRETPHNSDWKKK